MHRLDEVNISKSVRFICMHFNAHAHVECFLHIGIIYDISSYNFIIRLGVCSAACLNSVLSKSYSAALTSVNLNMSRILT